MISGVAGAPTKRHKAPLAQSLGLMVGVDARMHGAALHRIQHTACHALQGVSFPARHRPLAKHLQHLTACMCACLCFSTSPEQQPAAPHAAGYRAAQRRGVCVRACACTCTCVCACACTHTSVYNSISPAGSDERTNKAHTPVQIARRC